MSGRLPLLKPGELDQEQTKLYKRLLENQFPWANKFGFKVIEGDGSFLGPLNALLFNPGLGTTQIDLFQAEKRNSSLTDRIHEIIILTVGSVWDSAYELYAHSAIARETYTQAFNHFGNRGLVDIVLLIGLYMTVCSILNAFEVSSPE